MDGIAFGATRYTNNFFNIEIAFAGCGWAYGVGFVGQPDVQGFAVYLAENSGGADTEFATSPEDADGDFAAVGNQDFLNMPAL
jgi:hypothetical protein